MAGGPHVGHGPVVEPDLGSAPGPADAELLQPVHRSLHRDPQEHLKPLPRTTPPTKPIPAASTLGGEEGEDVRVIFSAHLWCYV